MKDWKTIKQELLKNPEVRTAYDELEPEYKLAHSLIKARIAQKMTQAELAERAGVSQVMIARLESGTNNSTVGTVSRVAAVLGKELKLVAA
ncbi:MAG: helix-turn-helix transcriptional regulator [Candidatus Saccharimonadales bacterium]